MSEKDQKNIYIAGFIDEFSGCKPSENELNNMRMLLGTIINSTQDFIWAVDPQNFGLLVFNNRLSDNFLKTRGIRVKTGMTPEDLYPGPDFIDEWKNLYQRALREGSFTTEYAGKTGPHIMELNLNLLKRDGKIIGISVFGKDITERKQSEAQRISDLMAACKQERFQLYISEETKNKWQNILDIIAKLLNVPASLIMRIVDSDIAVFLSSQTENNPYKPGDKEHLKDSGLYCETVLKTNNTLLVPNALADEHWKNNPDVKLNMISYLGYPISLPDKTHFGTICVLDDKENEYSEMNKQLILSFRDTIEKDIEMFYMNHSLNVKNNQLNHNISKINALLAEKELLLKEVHHRIKNNMNTVAGIMSLQIETLKEPSAVSALNDARGRVASMMLLYDKLYRSDDLEEISFKEYISPLVDEIVKNFPNSGIVKMEKNIGDFIIDAKRLSTLGIIVNEIITNIMKYAFTGRSNGLITVSAMSSDNLVTITIADDGIGIPESIDISTADSFGLQLLDMMTEQLKGEIKIVRGNGTKFILEFNL